MLGCGELAGTPRCPSPGAGGGAGGQLGTTEVLGTLQTPGMLLVPGRIQDSGTARHTLQPPSVQGTAGASALGTSFPPPLRC